MGSGACPWRTRDYWPMATKSVDEPRDRRRPAGDVRLATKADLNTMCSTLVEAFASIPSRRGYNPRRRKATCVPVGAGTS